MSQLNEEEFTKDLLLNSVSRDDLYRLGLRFVALFFWYQLMGEYLAGILTRVPTYSLTGVCE